MPRQAPKKRQVKADTKKVESKLALIFLDSLLVESKLKLDSEEEKDLQAAESDHDDFLDKRKKITRNLDLYL